MTKNAKPVRLESRKLPDVVAQVGQSVSALAGHLAACAAILRSVAPKPTTR